MTENELLAIMLHIERAFTYPVIEQFTLRYMQAVAREVRVIALRYCGEHKLTLAQVGTELGVSRGRVRQIEARALRKLRHPSRSVPWRFRFATVPRLYAAIYGPYG